MKFIAFDPQRGSFLRLGTLSCDRKGIVSPLHLAIAHDGTALTGPAGCSFDVRTRTSTPTGAPLLQQGLEPWSLAFVFDPADRSETLYTAGTLEHQGVGISRVDARTLRVEPPHELMPDDRVVQIAGDDQGNIHLLTQHDRGVTLLRLDKQRTLQAMREVPTYAAVPFVWWQDQFVLFQNQAVFRLDPVEPALEKLADLPSSTRYDEVVIAAATINCAAQHVTELRTSTTPSPPGECLNTARGGFYFKSCRNFPHHGIAGDATQCDGFGFSTECAAYDAPVVSCQVDAHCTPLNGVARVCRRGSPRADVPEMSVCVVPCAGGSECPGGMRCIPDVPGFGALCMRESPFPALQLP